MVNRTLIEEFKRALNGIGLGEVLDEDIINYDLTSGDYNLPETLVAGSNEVTIAVASDQGNSFTVTVEWTDGSGTVLYTQSPSEATSVADANLNFITKSSHVQVNVTDTSNATNNDLDGTINAH